MESEVRDSQNNLLAKVVNNSIVFCDKLNYEAYGNTKVKGVKKKSNGEVLIEINIQGLIRIKIKGRFEHPTGHVLINDDDEIIQMPQNNRMIGNYFRTQTEAFELTDDSLFLG